MSATNSTTHYSLPSFLGSDKPSWLVDWNGAMATIDSAIYEAKQAADTASASASAVASDLATLAGTVSTQGTSISTLSDTLTTAVGNINTINSLIGNGTPTTTDQTIIGAINEINARTGAANGISYDNTDSGLSATNVQDAIDEIADDISGVKILKADVTVTATDGVATTSIPTSTHIIGAVSKTNGRFVSGQFPTSGDTWDFFICGTAGTGASGSFEVTYYYEG